MFSIDLRFLKNFLSQKPIPPDEDDDGDGLGRPDDELLLPVSETPEAFATASLFSSSTRTEHAVPVSYTHLRTPHAVLLILLK